MTKRKLVVIILNREELLDELLEGFVELDVRGATVIDSVGMGRIMSLDMPIFGSLRSLMTGARPYNKTILTVVDEEKVEAIAKVFEQICGSLDEPGTGLIFSLPVDYVKGLPDQSLS
ncbi:hypothetical protein H8D57_03605 [bacterium]|nr:hypothetical protein [bacterium]